MLIFHHHRQLLLRPPITLTHICRRWRQIAVNSASLWTNLCIDNLSRSRDALGSFLSLLSMQLDRTADLLLDVEWIAVIGTEYFVATLQLLREKAPFSQWKTMTLRLYGGSHEDSPWSSVDAFTNLESVTVGDGSDDAIFGVIDRTITSRLKDFNVRWGSASTEKITASFATSLTHISSFYIQRLHFPDHMPFLPTNVVKLRVDSGQEHCFPHVQTYTVRKCIFAGMDTIDLRRMTTLIVTTSLTVNFNCHVLLPALRELKLATLILLTGAQIEAPALDIVHFMEADDVCGEPKPCPETTRSLMERGYLLSPNTSIIADSHLLSTTLMRVLDLSPKITHATLRFESWIDAQMVLGRLVGFNTETGSEADDFFCPWLAELKLDLRWEFTEPSPEKEWILDNLKPKEEAGLKTHLSVYVGWKGEGTYVLLTGD
jgi:hypothetical protein